MIVRPGYLYFILNPALRIVKIGVTRRVVRRQRELEMASGCRLQVLLLVADGGASEARLHEAFAADRVVGEWFKMSRDLRALINRATAPDASAGDVIDRFLGHSDPQRVRRAAERAIEERAAAEMAARKAKREAELSARRDAHRAKSAANALRLKGEWWREFVTEAATTPTSRAEVN